MKKLALAICLLLASIAAQAQFEKGTMILNPSVTGLDFSYSKNDDAKFGIGAQAGTFLADGFAFSPVVGCDHDTVIGSDQTETADHLSLIHI